MMADSLQKCTARGGIWNPVTKKCSISELIKVSEEDKQTRPTSPQETTTGFEPSKSFTEKASEKKANIAAGSGVSPPPFDPLDPSNLTTLKSQTPTVTKETEEKATTELPRGTVVNDAETGRPVGFIDADGNFVASERADIQNVVSKPAAKDAPIQGGTSVRQIQQQEELQQAISQIGQIGKLSAATQADINFSQAATAGLAAVLPGVLTGGAVGAISGGGPLSGLTALGGAAIGGGGGFIRGLLGNIKEQQRGELAAAKIELTNGRTALRQLAMAASRDPANADIYIQQYNKVLTRMHQARRQTKVETQGDLNAFMEDGREDLAQFDSMLNPGGLAEIYGQKLITSLNTGIPLSINGEELFFEQ